MTSSPSPSAILSRYTLVSPEPDESINEENAFCSEDNVPECAAYLDQELESLGVRPMKEPSVVGLLNIVYSLIQHNRSTARKMDDITNSLYRARSDLSLQTEAVARLKISEESLERSISLQKETERQLTQRNRTLAAKLKAEKEEVRRLQQRQQYEEQKYLHTIKKKDREYTRLKDRLGELVLNKSQEKRLGIKTLNALQKQRKIWTSTSKSGEDMYKLIVTHYDQREKELMLENSSLRESLLNMEKELVTLLNERLGDYRSATVITDDNEECEAKLMDSGCFRMPFDIIREDIEQSLKEKYQKLRDHISHLKARNAAAETHSCVHQYEAEAAAVTDIVQSDEEKRLDSYEEEIEQLLKQLSDYQEVITQQEEVIKKGMKDLKNGDQNKESCIMSPSVAMRRIEDLEKRESRMKEREQLIVVNENKLMEATRDLDRERRDFEDQKGQFYKQQFLESSIFVTPSKTAPGQLNSFFTGLSSTPFPPSSAMHPKSIRCVTLRTPRTKYSDGTSSSSYQDTPNKENILFGGSPVLRKGNISLSSDEGTKILNEHQ